MLWISSQSIQVGPLRSPLLRTSQPQEGDVFGGEFGEFDLGEGEFGGGMEDIEVPRNSKTVAFADDKNQTDRTSMQV